MYFLIAFSTESDSSIASVSYSTFNSLTTLLKNLLKVSAIYSYQEFAVFLFSVKISWKFLILWMLARKLKSEFIIGGAITFTILYTSVMRTCKFFWWILGSFFSLNICWNSLLVSFLHVSLKPLSCNLLIKLFDCLEQNIQTNRQ